MFFTEDPGVSLKNILDGHIANEDLATLVEDGDFHIGQVSSSGSVSSYHSFPLSSFVSISSFREVPTLIVVVGGTIQKLDKQSDRASLKSCKFHT